MIVITSTGQILFLYILVYIFIVLFLQKVQGHSSPCRCLLTSKELRVVGWAEGRNEREREGERERERGDLGSPVSPHS